MKKQELTKQQQNYQDVYNYVIDHMSENDSDYGFNITVYDLGYTAHVSEEELDAKELDYRNKGITWGGREAAAAEMFTNDIMSLTYSDLEYCAAEYGITPKTMVENFNFEVSNTRSNPLHPADNH